MPERWLLIASRAPTPHGPVLWDDAARLAGSGADVTVVLTDDTTVESVLPSSPVTTMRAAGVTVLVDHDAAGRRGLLARLGPQDLCTTAQVAALLLAPDVRTVWR